MSSIDERALREFYRTQLAPAAARLRERRSGVFELGATDEESWYVDYTSGTELGEMSTESFEDRLYEVWKGDPELLELIPGLMEMSRGLEVKLEETDDVSPFIYIMF